MNVQGDSDLFSESSSDDDLELLLNHPRVKNENYLEEIVPHYSDEVFFEHFRLSRATANSISQRYQTSPRFNDQVGHYRNLCAFHQVLIYLWYIGHQTASFRDVADRFNITISSLGRIVTRLTYFLSNLSPEVIKWPTEDEKKNIEEHFRTQGFPNVIGAIDGTHIQIDRPENDPESYINRKGYYSIQMQVVCDHTCKILDVFVGYPGSVHDSRVYRNSPLKQNLQQKCGRCFLLGDSGYPLENNLLTPYKDRENLTRRQRNYNVKLSKNRCVIEHCFGILKQKFRQLYHIKLRNVRTIVHFLRAACVLHNIALEDNFVMPDEAVPNQPQQNVEANDDENDDDDEEVEDEGAQALRNRIANSLPL
nr:unnamed protein product [Callosobruchus analis]